MTTATKDITGLTPAFEAAIKDAVKSARTRLADYRFQLAVVTGAQAKELKKAFPTRHWLALGEKRIKALQANIALEIEGIDVAERALAGTL